MAHGKLSTARHLRRDRSVGEVLGVARAIGYSEDYWVWRRLQHAAGLRPGELPRHPRPPAGLFGAQIKEWETRADIEAVEAPQREGMTLDNIIVRVKTGGS
jgi:hypothetical protein